VAAAAGEEAKDTQYLDSVVRSGGDFIPLVCGSFGIWTPYDLAMHPLLRLQLRMACLVKLLGDN